jgi:hypothetical protein
MKPDKLRMKHLHVTIQHGTEKRIKDLMTCHEWRSTSSLVECALKHGLSILESRQREEEEKQ